MKITKITIALVLFVMFACDDDPVTSSFGCRTAVDKGTNQREFLRCETQAQFNPTNIRSSQWDTTDSTHYDYSWDQCDQCK